MADKKNGHTEVPEGFVELQGSANVARWLSAADLEVGYAWRGTLLDAQLIAGDEGDYRVVYQLRLTASPPQERANVHTKAGHIALTVGDVVSFGEKADLVFRKARLGDEVYFVCTGEKDVGRPSPMKTFRKAIRSTKNSDGPVIDLLLHELWQRAKQTGGEAPF